MKSIKHRTAKTCFLKTTLTRLESTEVIHATKKVRNLSILAALDSRERQKNLVIVVPSFLLNRGSCQGQVENGNVDIR